MINRVNWKKYTSRERQLLDPEALEANRIKDCPFDPIVRAQAAEKLVMQGLKDQGFQPYADSLIQGQLSDAFWDSVLPQALDTSVASSPYFRIFQAAQVKMNDKGFLSRDITVRELIEVLSDVHHVFPRNYLKKKGLNRGQYNQIANYVVAQSEINTAIGNKEPKTYFSQLKEQCQS